MIPRRAFLALAASVPVGTLLLRRAHAASPAVFAPGGVAINGYDPVAYFTESAPVAGSPDVTHDWNGAVWQFASAANRDAFATDPDAYAPKYGGYCAYAVSKGAIATTEPEAWTVHDGKLYLNYSRNVRALWREDVAGNIALADANWPGVLDA